MYRVSRSDPPVCHKRGKYSDFRLSRHPDEESILLNKIDVRPATAKEFFQGQLKKLSWKRGVELILTGTRDEKSPLGVLRGHESTLVRDICSYLTNQFDHYVKLTIPAALVGKTSDDESFMHFVKGRESEGYGKGWYERRLDNQMTTTSNGFEDGFVAFARCGKVQFPDPVDRNVNMMPFIFGQKDSLPDNLQCYHPLIEQCPYMKDEAGNVGYLTVHESYIDVGEAQRREGLHIESPGVFSDDPNAASFTPGTEHPWGCGVFYGPDRYEGGIYFASSVANTSEVWDALVDKNIPGIVDKHGGCEHLRSLIGNGTKLEAGELIWMTDCTPHEALPQKASGYRQFFRVVTPYISHWYAQHSTHNPKVPLPPNVTVIHDDKFVKKA